MEPEISLYRAGDALELFIIEGGALNTIPSPRYSRSGLNLNKNDFFCLAINHDYIDLPPSIAPVPGHHPHAFASE